MNLRLSVTRTQSLEQIPVNNDFEPMPDGVEIFFTSSAIHADIVMPIETAIDWRDHFPAECFVGDVRGATHVTVGLGDRAIEPHVRHSRTDRSSEPGYDTPDVLASVVTVALRDLAGTSAGSLRCAISIFICANSV